MNRVKEFRERQGWTQADLAACAGISRAAVSAIEIGRIVPAVSAALALANALSVSVEDLFLPPAEPEPKWAWPPTVDPCRFWQAEVGGRVWLFPAETTAAGLMGHDGLERRGRRVVESSWSPQRTLVLASCDPAASLLAEHFARGTPFRLIVLQRSSSEALRLAAAGVVHVAGVHLARSGGRQTNAGVVRERHGAGYSLLHLARWREGVAISPAAGCGSLQSALRQRLRWIGREPGSGARQCLDRLFEGRPPPRLQARDHRGVAEAIRSGFADAGVCVQLASEEAGLKFLSLQKEDYDLCFRTSLETDPRVRALIEIVRSEPYRRLLGELPGYELPETGELETLA